MECSPYDEEKNIITALKNGANGYHSKPTNSSEILHSLERLREGGNLIDPIIAQKMIDSVIIPLKKQDYHLTKREKDLIKLLIEGKSITVISLELGISYFTAETHRKNIFQKLDVHTTHALVAKSLKEGFTDLNFNTFISYQIYLNSGIAVLCTDTILYPIS